MNNVAPSATSGVPVISQGSAAQPIFGTAVVAGGGTGLTSATAYAVLTGGTTSTGAFQSIASVGTTGQVLTSNGAGALPTFQAAASGGNLVLISSQTASASASIAFTSGITATYNNYVMLISNLQPGTTGQNLQLQFSSNGGSSYFTSGYLSGNTFNLYNATTWNNNNQTAAIYVNVGCVSTQFSSSWSNLFDMTSGNGLPKIITKAFTDNNGNTCLELNGAVYNTGSTTVNAIKFTFSSGTIATGTFTLFGLLE